ncbi:MAG: hypothetical protein KAU62_10275 [Candidatus Heimdallarchaeota archaeon]|nr:hypothetical protein [Candidatus Heimdallarchaeota archaeon]MCK4611529.1 hypothetical protein [Candidatus Heimdallarchaeota archaeon]
MILFECDSDAELIKKLLPDITKREMEHKHGKGNVLKWIFQMNNSIGMVDKDYITPKYKEMEEVEVNEYFRYSVFKTSNNNYVIELNPKLEGWILRVSSLENVDIRKFGFSRDENEFHRQANIRIDKFKQLLDILLSSEHLFSLKELFQKYYFGIRV